MEERLQQQNYARHIDSNSPSSSSSSSFPSLPNKQNYNDNTDKDPILKSTALPVSGQIPGAQRFRRTTITDYPQPQQRRRSPFSQDTAAPSPAPPAAQFEHTSLDSAAVSGDERDDGSGYDDRDSVADEGDDGDEDEVGDIWESESVIDAVVHSMMSDGGDDSETENDLETDAHDNGEGSDGPSRTRTFGKTSTAEALQTRTDLVKQLHRLGPEDFVDHYLVSDKYTAKGLCEAFGLHFQATGLPDDHVIYYRALSALIRRELTRRLKLTEFNSIDDAVELLKTRKNILVLTGAGISTSLGIPDFRSKDGLYNMLRNSPLADLIDDDPQNVFALDVFKENPAIFFTVAKSILCRDLKYSPTHSFIKLLQDCGKLLTNYTQNIDNFEACAGIDSSKLVHCHGSFATATCMNCGHRVNGSEIEPEISAGRIPKCSICIEMLRRRRASVGPSGLKRKRSKNPASVPSSRKGSRRPEWEDSSDDDDDLEDLSDDAAGVMKPDIVFFGEDLPREFHERLTKHDKDLVDLVIVIGTSLMVAPVADVPGFISSHVPQIYISREPCRHIDFDIELLGDCDVVVAELCRRAGWDLEHHMIPLDETTAVKTDANLPHRHRFSRVVPAETKPADQIPIQPTLPIDTSAPIATLSAAARQPSEEIEQPQPTALHAPRPPEADPASDIIALDE